jgi:predicted ATPase
MSRLPRQFEEDRALRDAARKVLDADLTHLKESHAEQGIVGRIKAQVMGRISNRISDGARDVLDQAKEKASDHRGVLAALLGAIILWFARGPLLQFLGLDDAETDEADEIVQTED